MDLEVLTNMLERAGVNYEVEPSGTLMVWGGYNGFYTAFSFDKDGYLTEVGAYE